MAEPVGLRRITIHGGTPVSQTPVRSRGAGGIFVSSDDEADAWAVCKLDEME